MNGSIAVTLSISPGRNLTWDVVNDLGGQIVRGDYAPGDMIPNEASLGKEFGVGRSAIREAVKMLTAKGLVDPRPKRGTAVLPLIHWNFLDADVLSWALDGGPDRSFFIELIQMRSAIEPESAALAAERQNSNDIAAIRRAFERLKHADENQLDLVSPDLEFHTAIVVASGNRFMRPLLTVHEAALKTSFRVTNAAFGQKFNLPAHEKILRAIERGRPELARRSVRALLDASHEVFKTGKKVGQ